MQPPQTQYVQPVQYPQQPMMQQQMMQQPMMHQGMVQQGMMQPQVVVYSHQGSNPNFLVAYILWFFLGIFGVHHLYIGRGIGIWLVSLITMQGLGFWWLIDLFLIPSSCSKMR